MFPGRSGGHTEKPKYRADVLADMRSEEISCTADVEISTAVDDFSQVTGVKSFR